MIKYRLHNITDFGVELHDFYTENSLNNYIALFVDPPYWVENLETHENLYTGFDGHTETHLFNENTAVVTPNKLDVLNVSRETLHETPTEWIARNIPTEEKESYTKLEKISSFLCILSVIIMATFLLYLFLSSVSFIAEHLSQFTWKVFNML
nr:MAG TPA: hypothetical protein [Caudoviricetes sp.]